MTPTVTVLYTQVRSVQHLLLQSHKQVQLFDEIWLCSCRPMPKLFFFSSAFKQRIFLSPQYKVRPPSACISTDNKDKLIQCCIHLYKQCFRGCAAKRTCSCLLHVSSLASSLLLLSNASVCQMSFFIYFSFPDLLFSPSAFQKYQYTPSWSLKSSFSRLCAQNFH